MIITLSEIVLKCFSGRYRVNVYLTVTYCQHFLSYSYEGNESLTSDQLHDQKGRRNKTDDGRNPYEEYSINKDMYLKEKYNSIMNRREQKNPLLKNTYSNHQDLHLPYSARKMSPPVKKQERYIQGHKKILYWNDVRFVNIKLPIVLLKVYYYTYLVCIIEHKLKLYK